MPETTVPSDEAWQAALIARLQTLGPSVGDRLVARPPTGSDLVPAERFGEVDFLRRSIVDCGESLAGSMDGTVVDDVPEMRLAVAASRFTRHYVSSLTSAALVGLASGLGLDLSPRRCVMVVRGSLPRQSLVADSDDGLVTCDRRPSTWRTEGGSVSTVDDLRRYVWSRLYAEHLAPLFAATTVLTGAAPQLLWSNAAEWVAYVADSAVERLGQTGAVPIVEESEALLHADAIPGIDGPNPLAGLMAWIPVEASDFPRGVPTRRHCCITYLLPARLGRLCENCPFLPLGERIALGRETRQAPGARGGPAEMRSIAIGLKKVRPKPGHTPSSSTSTR
jgi:Ferric iron reductase FhuF-like transporter